MSYATQSDMLARYGMPKLVQLTDINTVQTGELVASVLASRLDDASAEIDGYLVGRMALPLASPPAILKVLCCRLAYYLLLGAVATDIDVADVKAVRAYLTQVGNGSITLTSPDTAPAVAGAGSVLFNSGDKSFGREGDTSGDWASS